MNVLEVAVQGADADRYRSAIIAPMLNIKNLSYLQGGIQLLENVNLQAYTNQRIGLVGKNGCGKSRCSA